MAALSETDEGRGTGSHAAWAARSATIGAGLTIFSVYLLTGSLSKGNRPNVDTLSALIPAWSLGQRGTLEIPEYLRATPWIQQHGDSVLSDRMPGIIFWATPFYRAFGDESGPSLGVAALAAATATTLAVIVLQRLFSLVLEPTSALVAAGLAAFGTATWTVSAQALWPHGMNQMWIAVAMLMLARGRYLTSGLAFAAGIFTRPHLAVAAAVCGIWAGIDRRSLAPVLKIGLTSSLGVVALVAYNRVVFGQTSLFVGVYSERPDTAGAKVVGAGQDYGITLLTQVAGTLVSPLRGILVLSPFLLMLLPGLRSAWRAAPTWVRSSAVAGLAYMSVQLLGNGFQGGSYFYSYRLPIEMLTLAAPLLALAWREWTVKRMGRQIAFAALATLSVVQHAIGAFVFTDTIDFETRAWTRSQVLEGLSQANLAELGGLALIAAACGACSWVVIRRSARQEPSALGPPVTRS